MKKIDRKTKHLIKKYVSGEISRIEEKILFSISETNKEVKEILAVQGELKKGEIRKPDNKKTELLKQNVLEQINKKQDLQRPFVLSDLINNLLYRPAFAYSLAVIMFILGFYVQNLFFSDNLIQKIQISAEKTHDLQSSNDEPYIYSNASFKKTNDGYISVSFDVTRHLNIISDKNDPLIQEIMAQSIINTSNVASRLKYISNSEQIMHPKIKQALISTMLYDNHEVVRQESMTHLLKYPNDEDIEKALLVVLENEESVYMKISAIKYLGNHLDNNQFKNNRSVQQQLKKLNY